MSNRLASPTPPDSSGQGALPPAEGPSGKPSWLGHLKSDFLSSIVVFLVALPLCMGIATACGLPPAQGIITGIVGGLVVGWLAGCPLQVSGPAAGLFVVVRAQGETRRAGQALPVD